MGILKVISQGNIKFQQVTPLCQASKSFSGQAGSSRWFTSGCLKGNSEINPWMNYPSWLFLGEGTSLGYHLSETVLKILVIICIFLLRGNRVSLLLVTVHLKEDDLFLQIPAGGMHRRGSPFFYGVVSLAHHFLILCKYLPSSQDTEQRNWLLGIRLPSQALCPSTSVIYCCVTPPNSDS